MSEIVDALKPFGISQVDVASVLRVIVGNDDGVIGLGEKRGARG
jgi:hypothetical protein